jgi:hypothetical protein
MWLDIRLNDQILFTQNSYEKVIHNGRLGKLISVENIGGAFPTDTNRLLYLNLVPILVLILSHLN